MKNWYEDVSTLLAAFGIIVLGTVAAGLLYKALGWVGIALFGVVGLFVTVHLKMSGGRAIHGADHGSTSVGMIARQISAETENMPAEQRRAEAERRKTRERFLNVIALVFLALTALAAAMLLIP